MKIEELAKLLTILIHSNELDALILEEELLVKMIRSEKVPSSDKSPIFRRLEQINKRQDEILGRVVSKT